MVDSPEPAKINVSYKHRCTHKHIHTQLNPLLVAVTRPGHGGTQTFPLSSEAVFVLAGCSQDEAGKPPVCGLYARAPGAPSPFPTTGPRIRSRRSMINAPLIRRLLWVLTGSLDRLLLATIDRPVWIALRSVTLHCERLQFLKVTFPPTPLLSSLFLFEVEHSSSPVQSPSPWFLFPGKLGAECSVSRILWKSIQTCRGPELFTPVKLVSQ